MWLELPDSEEKLWQQVGTKVRAQVKRSRRFGLSVQFGGLELLEDFYQVFSENMRDLGTPVYDKSFFRNLYASGIGQQQLVVVRHDGKPVSAAYLVAYQKRMEVPWASTLRSANQYDANMFLYWELLSFACNQGCRGFDFGRSTVNAATYKFKKQWGAQPRQLYWHYWLQDGGDPPRINPDNPKYRLVIGVWQRLPVWLTRLVGPGIVKFLP
jgi:FemAB-related protein (PEP-CTERM system-associated)